MKYVGELYFEDDDIIKVDSFIVRSETEVVFSLVANWNGGKWSKSGGASFDGKSYITDIKPTVHVETGAKGPVSKITFSKVEENGKYLCIEGSWYENGESYFFEGDLEK